MPFDGWTLAFQIINFLVLIWLLQRFLYRPVKRVVDTRRAQANEALDAAYRANEDAEDKRRHYESLIEDFDKERQQLLKKLHDDFAQEKTALLKTARDEATRMKQGMAEELDADRQASLEAVQNQIFDLSAKLARMLLADSGSDALNALFLEHLLTSAEALAKVDRNHSASLDPSKPSNHVCVTTATELDAASQEEWRRRLRMSLSKDVQVKFETDPALLGGSVARFPHTVVDLSWRTMLNNAQAAVTG